MTPARPAARAPRRPAVTWSAWALCGLSVTLALASIVLATINGESPAELVTNHHAIGILDALTLPIVGTLVVLRERRLPRRVQLHPAVRAPGARPHRTAGVAAGWGAGELAGVLDQRPRHRDRRRLPAP